MNSRREGGFILAFAVVVLMLSAGLVLHVLAESGLRTRAATAVWEDDRLMLAAGSGVRRVLDAFRKGDIPETGWVPDPAAPYLLWSAVWTAPDGTRVSARLMDAQRRFDLNNLIPGETGQAEREAVRIASDLLERWGDPDPSIRIAAIVRALTPARADDQAPVLPAPDVRPLLDWHAVFALPEFDHSVMRALAGGQEGYPSVVALPLIRLAGFLPDRDDRPLPVNLNTADAQVVFALLGREQRAAAERVLAARQKQPLDTVEQAAGLSGLAPDRLVVLRPWVTTRSRWFEIEARAELNGRARSVWALLHRDSSGDEVRVRQWAYER